MPDRVALPISVLKMGSLSGREKKIKPVSLPCAPASSLARPLLLSPIPKAVTLAALTITESDWLTLLRQSATTAVSRG
jgi:hypothetical protein